MRKAAPACPTCCSRRARRPAPAPGSSTPGRCIRGCRCRADCASTTAGSRAKACCRRGFRLTTGLDARTRLRVAAGRYTQSPGYEKTVQSDYVLDLTSDAAGPLRSEQAVQVSAGLERSLGRGFELRLDGYVKRFTDVLIGQLESEADRQARDCALRLPGGSGRQHPHRSADHDGARQRRPWHRLRRGRAGVAAGRRTRRPAARLGQLHLGPGRARRLRAHTTPSSTTAGTRSRWSRRCSSRAAGNWRRRREWRRVSPAPRRWACAWRATTTSAIATATA